MPPDAAHLAQPLPLRCGATLANRLVKAATSEYLAGPDGLPTARHLAIYRAWGQGGAAAILTGNVMVDRDHREARGNLILEAGTPLAPFVALAEAIHQGGALALAQINHPGRQSPRAVNPAPVAPSVVPLKRGGYGFVVPRALESAEIPEIIARFAATARQAVAAGLDGVQIHAAHGYLLSQFLAPNLNLRQDAWGGDPERRRALLLAVVRAVREAVGPDRIVAVKLNSNDLQRGGIDADEAAGTLRALDALGLDFVELSGGTYEVDATLGRRDRPEREAYFLDFARAVRATVQTPLMLTGGFRSRAAMAGALARGEIDLVGLARPILLEPDLPRRLCDPGLGEVCAREFAPPSLGLKPLNAAMELACYEEVIAALAEGRPARTGRWAAFAGAVRHFL